MNFKSDNIARVGAAGLLPTTMADIRRWKKGVRFRTLAALADGRIDSPLTEVERWDRLIAAIPEPHHENVTGKQQGVCTCFRCRPNRRYK